MTREQLNQAETIRCAYQDSGRGGVSRELHLQKVTVRIFEIQ